MALNRCFIFTTAFRPSSPAISVLIRKRKAAGCALLQQGLENTTRNMSTTFKKVQVVKLTSDFGAATEIKEVPIVPPAVGEIRVRNSFAGVNATDINISAGRYFTDGKVPFDVGFEGLGVIDAIGSDVTGGFTVGQNVLYIGSKGFSEVIYAKPEELVPAPDLRPEYIATLVCGLTAAIGLDVVSHSFLTLGLFSISFASSLSFASSSLSFDSFSLFCFQSFFSLSFFFSLSYSFPYYFHFSLTNSSNTICHLVMYVH